MFDRVLYNLKIKKIKSGQFSQYPPKYQKLLNEAIRKTRFDIEAGNEAEFKSCIYEIITGKTNAVDEDFKNNFAKKFKYKKLFVVIFELNDYVNLFKDDSTVTDEQKLCSLKLILSNILREFLHSFGAVEYFTEIDGRYIAIINIEKIYSRMNIISALNQTDENIYNYFGVHLKAALSSDVKNIEHLYRGYNEALTAGEYFKLDESSIVLSFADIIKNVNNSPFEIKKSSQEDFNDIMLCISNSNYDDAKKLISELIKSYLDSVGISFVSFKFITYETAINIINRFRDYISDEQYINKIFQQNAIPIDEVLELTKYICGNIREGKLNDNIQTDKKEKLVQDIVRYIDRNYDDIDLNIAKLAENFDYVPSYLSKIFRTVKNVNLIDFLNKKRVEEAKHLLINTDKVLSEIASMTGFCSDAALIRVFKKYEGTTPVNFKKEYYKTE